MSGVLLIVIGVSLVVMVLVLTVGRSPGGRRRPPARSISGMAERERAAESQFEVEEHDIEEMLRARNALRARIGKPPLGDELADDVRRERPEEGD
jgi:hypothetical protein